MWWLGVVDATRDETKKKQLLHACLCVCVWWWVREHGVLACCWVSGMITFFQAHNWVHGWLRVAWLCVGLFVWSGGVLFCVAWLLRYVHVFVCVVVA